MSGQENKQKHEENHQGGEQQNQIDNQQYYQILGVDKNATQEQIRNAYEKIMQTLQPEQNQQDLMKLQLIQEAYSVLSDPELKARYDKQGKFQDEDDETGGQDIFSMFFGGGGQKKQGGQAKKPKVQSSQKPLYLTLENIYKGQKITVAHTRTRICQKCQGKGGANATTCQQCDGKGAVIGMYQMGPGMYQQVRKACEKCVGKGQIIQQADICPQCKGNKILQKQTQIEVNVQKGIPKGSPIKIQGQGNQIPGALAGDLIFVIQEKQHELFKRIGADLYMKKNITLLEALTGFTFTLTHLDGTVYTVSTEKGQVIGDEDKKIIKGLGMPFYKDPTDSGNLIIQFHVVMPKREQITKEQRKQIISVLPGEVNPRPTNEDYKMFEDLDLQNLNTNQQGGKKPQDQYDEDAQQHGVQCGTQ